MTRFIAREFDPRRRPDPAARSTHQRVGELSDDAAAEGVALSRRMAVRALVALGLSGAGGLSGALAAAPGSATAGPATGPGVALGGADGPTVARGPRGDLTDPDLLHPVVPWERTLSADALEMLEVLVDLILPADERSPGAAALGAHEFVDEWVSAPYDAQRADRALVLTGLEWLTTEASVRFGAGFVALDESQQTTLCELVCHLPDAEPDHRTAAEAFALIRDLTAAAFWTTEAGRADLQYVGNAPQPNWRPPPREVLEHLGLG